MHPKSSRTPQRPVSAKRRAVFHSRIFPVSSSRHTPLAEELVMNEPANPKSARGFRFPSLETLLALPIREVAALMVAELASRKVSVFAENLEADVSLAHYQLNPEARRALFEGLEYAITEGLIAHDPLSAGSAGLHPLRVTKRGHNFLKTHDADYSWRDVSAAELLHSTISGDAFLELRRGQRHYADAVFKAFRAVEMEVRDAGGFSDSDVGVPLMRRAFGREGPLTDPAQNEGEQDAITHLFAGAIGALKNPGFHRAVGPSSASSALRSLILASELLAIVDEARSRAASTGTGSVP